MVRKVLIFTISLFCLASCTKEEGTVYNARGKVIDQETGLGIDSALVVLYSALERIPSDQPSQKTYTNAAGEFRFQQSSEDLQFSEIEISRGPEYIQERYLLKPDGSSYSLAPSAVLRFAIFSQLSIHSDTTLSATLSDPKSNFRAYINSWDWRNRNAFYYVLKGNHDYQMKVDMMVGQNIFRTDSFPIRIAPRDTLAYTYAPGF